MTQPTDIPDRCNGAVHAWPADWQSGDTCLCGAYYMTSDGAAAAIEAAHVERGIELDSAATISERASYCRAFLHIHGFLTDAENGSVKRRLNKKT